MREVFKNLIPNWAKAAARKSLEIWKNTALYTSTGVEGRCLIVTFHKSGSQWFRSILDSEIMHVAADYRFYTYKLLPLKGFDSRPLQMRRLPEGLANGIYGPLYIAPECLCDGFGDLDRVAVIIRDPRNVIISWYDSLLYTHAEMGDISAIRKQLAASNEAVGIDVMIDHAHRFGTFKAMDSWLNMAKADNRVSIFRFEDIFGVNGEAEYTEMLSHFGLVYDPIRVHKAFERFSFNNMAKKNKHYKEGKKRQWNERLNDSHQDRIATLCPITTEYYAVC